MHNVTARLRQDTRTVIEAAIRSADPAMAVAKHVRVHGEQLRFGSFELKMRCFQSVHVLGAGKAGAGMARALAAVLNSHLTDGVICVKDGYGATVPGVRVQEAGHPVPDGRSFLAAEEVLTRAQSYGDRDLVFCLLSGGASALWCQPAGDVSLNDKGEVTRILLGCGADIHQINTVRKHLSAIKGGQLAAVAHPATLVTLAISDVIGNELSVIGSGPTSPDTTTYGEALNILMQYRASVPWPPSVLHHLQRGAIGEIAETPGPDHPAFDRSYAAVIASNHDALHEAEAEARRLGYQTILADAELAGEARVVGRSLAAQAMEIANGNGPVKPPAMLIAGGETTVTIKGDGTGGRNQELALAAAIEFAGRDGIVLASVGTDGSDGPTDAAGACADGTTVGRGLSKGIRAEDFLTRNDSYAYWNRLDDLIHTGPTGTNVMDIQVAAIA